jgi:hypothetical protein
MALRKVNCEVRAKGTETMRESGANEECVRLLYRYLLGREADPDGLKIWTALADRERSINGVLQGLVESAEFKARTATSKSREMPSATLSACRERLRRDLLFVDVGAQRLSSEDHIYAPLLRSGLGYRIVGFEPLQHRLVQFVEKAQILHPNRKQPGYCRLTSPNFKASRYIHTEHQIVRYDYVQRPLPPFAPGNRDRGSG